MAYKERAMVFHQGCSTSPAATNHPAACLLLPKPGRVSDGATEPNPHAEEDEEVLTGKPKGFPSQEHNRTSDGLTAGKCSAGSKPQSDNLSPVIVCRGVKVTLDNNSMWNEFFRCKTEMILTKQGSRMFPYCRFRISGLQPSKKYSLFMDIQPLDGNRYRWTGKSWQVAGKAEGHVKSRPFAHPESPSTGQHWMLSPVSFYQLKLTNCTLDLEGNTVLHPMHRYLPRMHVVQSDTDAKDLKLTGPAVVTFAFHQTAFTAVTTYQNSRFSQLKVDYNPFAKGLKEDGSGGPKLKLISGKDAGTVVAEQHPVKRSLKSLLVNHKPRSTKAADAKLSESSDLQRNSTSNNGQTATKASKDSAGGNSSPAQKLFSELIREAHVSLHRCNMNQLGIDNRSEQSNNKTTALRSNGTYEPRGNGGPAKSGETIATKRKVREDNSPLNSVTSKDALGTDCSGLSNSVLVASCNSSADSDPQIKAKAPSEAKLKQHKRPLPLPALARFLRQHSSKSRLTKTKPDSPAPALPPECRSCTESPLSDPRTKAGDDSTPDPPQASGHSEPRLHLGEVLNVTALAAETADKPFGPSCSSAVSSTDQEGPNGFLTSDSVAKSGSPDGPPGLPDSYQLSLITSSPTSSLLPLHNAELPAENSLLSPPDLPKSDPPLLDPELSSFGFEPLSPTSSPEPLPSLPVPFDLELHSAASQVTLKAASPEELAEDSSVFKWHTVLPLTEAYADPSYTTFQPPPQTVPRASVTSPLLPLQTPSYPEQQTPYPSNFTSAPDPVPSFEDNEQPLPFPAGLSPLALQMTLSPSFSSLDGDGLSPTPSIADLVHFFSTNDDLGMGVEFSNTEVVAVPCAPLVIEEANVEKPPQPVSPIPIDKPCRNKKCRRQKLVNEEDEKMDASTYAKMQPNLEEVEEQLFISFTSKEALRLHVADSDGTASQPQTEGHLQLTAVTPENECLAEPIASFEEILLKDLKQMRHRQAIHPVLQEVGLKMNLLDPTLAIDLQYLGVRLPIPPPGVPLDPLPAELPPTQGVSAAFVSRTGKTTDLTQIKGWREKFPPPEATSAAALDNPEAGPSSDLPRNLSAFCSDMLDEYLENEGKLIDQRASTFTQPLAEPVVYQLPTRSTSYVRTLDSVLKKQTPDSPASDLISQFIPPSKRPKLAIREAKTVRRRRGPKHTNPRPDPAQQIPDESSVAPNNPPVQIPVPPPLENTNSVTKPHQPKRHQQKIHFDHTKPQTWSSQPKQRRKLKPKTLSQTLSPAEPAPPPTRVSQDMAPLESDSELGTTDQSEKDKRPVMTRALLRQKDLEDGVLWGGRPRTSITEDRASVALTSLFTLKGFVRENPTAPIQWVRRPAPRCLNEACRLGCICSSLSYCSRISHCGRPACMFGCSCLKQKVVLLKNLDGSDSSPSKPDHYNNKKKRRSSSRRRRRMKMAYVLKEADSVTHPAERVRTLWKRGAGDSDPEPVLVPPGALALPPPSVKTCLQVRAEEESTCARIRVYELKKKRRKGMRKGHMERCDHTVESKELKPKDVRLKPSRQKGAKTKPASDPVPTPPPPPARHPSCPSEPKPSKRLTIVADCKWARPGDRNLVLKMLCEAMAEDQLDQPLWIRDYLISPIGHKVEDGAATRCIHYKMHISRPNPETPQRREWEPQQEPQKQRFEEAEPPEEWQREVEAEPPDDWQQAVEAEPPEEWQREVEAEPPEEWQREVEAEPPEEWQREVEEGEIREEEEEDGSTDNLSSRKEKEVVSNRKSMVSMALPFLTGVSPAGFLSANRKRLGETDHLVQVNGKLYPLAKIQLGKMGALHPANRLAAYLTGRVGSNGKGRPPHEQCAEPTSPPAAFVAPALPAPPADSQVSSSVASPVIPPSNGAPAPPREPPSPVRASCAPPPPPSTGQMMFLRPVLSKTGVQYYRRADGRLIQLVPISKLNPVNKNHTFVQKIFPPVLLQAPADNQTTPGTTVTPSSSSSSPLHPGFVAQAGGGTCQIPLSDSRDPMVLSCPNISSSPISLKPSTSGGAELGVKAVTVSPGPGGGAFQAPLETRPSSNPPEPVPPSEESEGGSSETDSSEEELDRMDEREKERHLHNVMEKLRRRKLFQLFKGLRKEVGLVEDKTSKIFTLNTAVEVIQLLKTVNSDLEKKKRRLRKRRDKYLSFILGERSNELSEGGATGSSVTGSSATGSSVTGSSVTGSSATGSSVTGSSVTGSSDGDLLDSSDESTEESDEESVVTSAIKVRNAEGEDRHVAMETAEESCRPDVSNEDSESRLSLTASFRGLREVMKTTCSSEGLLLDQARQEIQTLHSELARLTSMKTCLRQQRNAFIRDLSLRSGKSPLAIRRDVQNQSTCQRKMKGERPPTANQLPAAGGGASAPPAGRSTDTDHVITIPTSDPQKLAPQAPPTTECVQGPESVPPMSKPVLAPPDVSHNASAARERPRTFPNILSRCRNPATGPAVLPQGIRSLVRGALPGQQVLPVSPLQTFPSPGMTTVTLNLSNLTNQQIRLASMNHPPIAANFNVLPGFQPSSRVQRILPFQQIILQPHQIPTQQIVQLQPQILQLQPQILQPPQQILLHPQPMPAPPPPQPPPPARPSLLVSTGLDQEQPEASTRGGPSSSPCPGPRAQVTVGGPLGTERRTGEGESLTSLLDELFLLNQQNSSSEEGVAPPTETMRDGTHLAPAIQKADALAPPPLLQMKLGGATVADAPSSDVDAGGGGGWSREGGVAWRPMPRLVPLGLRGNPS
ncbi:MAX dimerization protein MGA a isoform X2 [Pungitius pungitius]|uniref:MAX dimerization protein MGA a isoform X2 n=1 Tax=Pungitius pungitius TaxID=134920 RepID=UPI002E13EE05